MTDAKINANSDAPAMSPADLAERVRRLRAREDLTQDELANRVGYAASTISKAENFHEGDGMVGARITIIETLTDETVEGPLYR